MTEHTIPRARHRTPARSDLLGDAMLPPIGTSTTWPVTVPCDAVTEKDW